MPIVDSKLKLIVEFYAIQLAYKTNKIMDLHPLICLEVWAEILKNCLGENGKYAQVRMKYDNS